MAKRRQKFDMKLLKQSKGMGTPNKEQGTRNIELITSEELKKMLNEHSVVLFTTFDIRYSLFLVRYSRPCSLFVIRYSQAPLPGMAITLL